LVVPHPCQNAPASAVKSGHSGDMRRRGDLDSGCYRCRPNKPDGEEVADGVSNQLSNDRSRREDPSADVHRRRAQAS